MAAIDDALLALRCYRQGHLTRIQIRIRIGGNGVALVWVWGSGLHWGGWFMATSTSYKLPACRYPKLRQPNQPPTIQTHTHTPPAGHASNLIWLRTCCSCCSPLLRFPWKTNWKFACGLRCNCVCMYVYMCFAPCRRVHFAFDLLSRFREPELYFWYLLFWPSAWAAAVPAPSRVQLDMQLIYDGSSNHLPTSEMTPLHYFHLAGQRGVCLMSDQVAARPGVCNTHSQYLPHSSCGTRIHYMVWLLNINIGCFDRH